MSSEETQKLEARVVALERKVEDLTGGYEDLAYTYLDSLVKRIEAIRDEVHASLGSVEERVRTEASQEITAVVAEAREKLRHEAIVESVIPALTDGSHVLVTRPASFEEHRSGKGIPVKQAPHKG